MANNPKDEREFEPVEPGTKAMESLLSVGYGGMTVEQAETIIKERKADPALWPYEKFAQAQAFLAAYTARSRPIATNPGWTRLPARS